MRHIRYRDASGVVRLALEQPPSETTERLIFVEANEPSFLAGITGGFTPSYRTLTADPEILFLAPDFDLLPPLDPPELWSAGATYPAGLQARIRESTAVDMYDHFTDDRRPHFQLVDANGQRTVGTGQPLAIRSDSTWTVPEPQLGVVIGDRGSIVGYTIITALCSRDLRGANPLYLSQATTYRSSIALGPAIYVEPSRRKGFTVYLRVSDEAGRELMAGKTGTKEMTRTFKDLVDWLARDNPLPPGTMLATGAGIVPPDSFTLQPGHVVEVHVPEIGTLSNPVVLVADLEANELAARRRAAVLSRQPDDD
jgi:2-dehydro-3-deoxy-D-arabinonate dehydratase